MSELRKECLSCGSNELYSHQSRSVSGTTDLYPGLGAFMTPASVTTVLCRECGHTSLYASKEAREKLDESGHWQKL